MNNDSTAQSAVKRQKRTRGGDKETPRVEVVTWDDDNTNPQNVGVTSVDKFLAVMFSTTTQQNTGVARKKKRPNRQQGGKREKATNKRKDSGTDVDSEPKSEDPDEPYVEPKCEESEELKEASDLVTRVKLRRRKRRIIPESEEEDDGEPQEHVVSEIPLEGNQDPKSPEKRRTKQTAVPLSCVQTARPLKIPPKETKKQSKTPQSAKPKLKFEKVDLSVSWSLEEGSSKIKLRPQSKSEAKLPSKQRTVNPSGSNIAAPSRTRSRSKIGDATEEPQPGPTKEDGSDAVRVSDGGLGHSIALRTRSRNSQFRQQLRFEESAHKCELIIEDFDVVFEAQFGDMVRVRGDEGKAAESANPKKAEGTVNENHGYKGRIEVCSTQSDIMPSSREESHQVSSRLTETGQSNEESKSADIGDMEFLKRHVSSSSDSSESSLDHDHSPTLLADIRKNPQQVTTERDIAGYVGDLPIDRTRSLDSVSVIPESVVSDFGDEQIECGRDLPSARQESLPADASSCRGLSPLYREDQDGFQIDEQQEIQAGQRQHSSLGFGGGADLERMESSISSLFSSCSSLSPLSLVLGSLSSESVDGVPDGSAVQESLAVSGCGQLHLRAYCDGGEEHKADLRCENDDRVRGVGSTSEELDSYDQADAQRLECSHSNRWSEISDDEASRVDTDRAGPQDPVIIRQQQDASTFPSHSKTQVDGQQGRRTRALLRRRNPHDTSETAQQTSSGGATERATARAPIIPSDFLSLWEDGFLDPETIMEECALTQDSIDLVADLIRRDSTRDSICDYKLDDDEGGGSFAYADDSNVSQEERQPHHPQSDRQKQVRNNPSVGNEPTLESPPRAQTSTHPLPHSSSTIKRVSDMAFMFRASSVFGPATSVNAGLESESNTVRSPEGGNGQRQSRLGKRSPMSASRSVVRSATVLPFFEDPGLFGRGSSRGVGTGVVREGRGVGVVAVDLFGDSMGEGEVHVADPAPYRVLNNVGNTGGTTSTAQNSPKEHHQQHPPYSKPLTPTTKRHDAISPQTNNHSNPAAPTSISSGRMNVSARTFSVSEIVTMRKGEWDRAALRGVGGNVLATSARGSKNNNSDGDNGENQFRQRRDTLSICTVDRDAVRGGGGGGGVIATRSGSSSVDSIFEEARVPDYNGVKSSRMGQKMQSSRRDLGKAGDRNAKTLMMSRKKQVVGPVPSPSP
ncbi:hypothetical protein HK102_013791, partial [Quaeritorhiza haematococci]